MLHRLLLSIGGTGGSFTLVAASFGWINVKDYGAVGNGSTDDTTAIANAAAVIPSTGGVLFFPPGTYLVSSAITITNPTLVLGSGGSVNRDFATGAATEIVTASGSNTVFLVAGPNIGFRDLFIHCTAASAPTAGAAITVTSATNAGDNLRLEDVYISGFYRGVDISYGSEWLLHNVRIVNPVVAGLRIENIAVPDGTDATISDCWIMAGPRTTSTSSAIIWRQGNGLRISNLKVNAGAAAYWGAGNWGYGMTIDVERSYGGTQIQITNSSFEGIQHHGIVGAFSGAGTNYFTDFLISNSEIASNGADDDSYGLVFTSVTAGSIDFRAMFVVGCVFRDDGTSASAAAAFSNCQKVRVIGCQRDGFSALTGFVTCTDAVASP